MPSAIYNFTVWCTLLGLEDFYTGHSCSPDGHTLRNVQTKGVRFNRLQRLIDGLLPIAFIIAKGNPQSINCSSLATNVYCKCKIGANGCFFASKWTVVNETWFEEHIHLP